MSIELHVFVADERVPETCRRCGGRLRVIASIEEPSVIDRILAHPGRALPRAELPV